MVSVTEEVFGNSSSDTRFSRASSSIFKVGDFVSLTNGDNTAYGYIHTVDSISIFLSLTKTNAFAGDNTGVSFQRTQGATTTIYRMKETLKFKEMLQCDIIGDPANYYSGQTYTNTGASQTVSIAKDETVVFNNGASGGGVIGNYYRRVGNSTTIDLSTVNYGGSQWADLGTTYNGQTWTNDGTSQVVDLEIGDIVFNEAGSSGGGTIGHYYRQLTTQTSQTLNAKNYDNTANSADLGRKYRGQQWTNDGTSQTVDVAIGEVVYNDGSSGGGTEGNFYQRINSNIFNANLSTTDYTVDFADLGPDWNESPAAGSWLQDGLGGFPLLTHADTGASLIPDGTSKTSKMSRKVTEGLIRVFSDDNGVTWSSDTAWNADIESAANARTASNPTGRVLMVFYTTDARFTEEADNAVVDMLGDVFEGGAPSDTSGTVLIKKVATGLEVTQALYLTIIDGDLVSPLSVSAAGSPATKLLKLPNA